MHVILICSVNIYELKEIDVGWLTFGTFDTLFTPNLRLIGNALNNWADLASRNNDWNANETPA